MKITFLSDEGSWKNSAIGLLAKKLRKNRHKVTFVHHAAAVPRGDVLFILGFFKIVPPAILARNKSNLVVHESDLPKGRGWSPLSWGVLKGEKSISLTLFEAVDKVDAGKIYMKDKIRLSGHELLAEIQPKVAAKMMHLCERFIRAYPGVLRRGRSQSGKATYYRKRQPADSRLDPNKTIAQQFNLLRIVDNNAYPAFFSHRGSTFVLKIEKKKI